MAVGALAGAQAVGAGLFAVVVPCLLVWLTAPRVSAPWVDAARIGADAWLAAHGATVVLPTGEVSLVPLGVTLLPLLICWSAGRRVGRALAPPSGAIPVRAAALAGAALASTYALLSTLVAVLAATPAAHPLEGQAAAGGLVVAALGAGAGLRPAVSALRPVPAAVAAPLRAAGVALSAWVGASALLVAVGLVLGRSRVTALAEALGAGVVGGAGLLLLQLALLPVVVVWAGAWFAGPGFTVGAGTTVTPAATSAGVLPALPVLGALPEPGTHPWWTWLVVAVPVLCGVLAGRSLRRARPNAPIALLRDAVATAAVCGAGAAVLSWWAGGAVGAGRMADLGPHPGWVGAALAGEVLAGCLIGVLLPAAGGSGQGAPRWVPPRAWSALPAWLRRPVSLRWRSVLPGRR